VTTLAPPREPLAPALQRTRRRQAVLFILLLVALLGMTGRLLYWQIGLHGPLSARADAEHLRVFSIAAGRGMILDSQGRVLALDVTKDSVIADPSYLRQLGTLDATIKSLASLLGLPASLVSRQLNVSGQYVQFHTADGSLLLLDLAQSQPLANAIDAGNLPGVQLYPVVQREYPDGALASQVLGFVRASDGIGQYGLEAAYNQALAGTPGQLSTAVDTNGNPLASGPQTWTPAVQGADITLTLDANIQDMAETGLANAIATTGADGGTVIVTDPHTGAILALANWPTFDPNNYGASPLSAFDDPAVSSQYDPGSVMKAFTMAGGIQAGVITPDTTFNDTGSVDVAGTTLQNWDGIAYGTETMTEVLQHSANVGAIWVAQRLGQSRFDSTLAAFGFGSRTGIDLPAETPGGVPHPSGASAAALTMAEQSFGESIAVTPLQVVAAYGALANGGVLMRPYIVACVAPDGGSKQCVKPQVVRQAVSAQTAQTVTQMLAQSDQYSDAEMYQITNYTVAAKTGTSTPDPANPSITYASVAGYAPASNPRFVILVKLDHPRSTIFGGFAAGPLWQSLAQQLFVYEGIAPDR
jgi:cell division protein FtsI/penicillin-binding protein 2